MAPNVSPIANYATSLIVAVILLSSTGGMSQSDCTNTIITMSSCLNYIQGSSPAPPSSCCTALGNVVQTNPRCLCQVLDGGSQFGITINVTRALSLPAACNVQTPPVSRCTDGVAPAPGPDGISSAGKGSKLSPGSDTSSASTSVTKMHLQVVGFFVLFVSSYISKFCFV